MTEVYKRPTAVSRALTVTTEEVGGKPHACVFRYYADRSIVCELRLPCDTYGQISPDGVLMLIAYLTRLVGGYDAQVH